MRTFWTFFGIFLSLVIAIQAFGYFTSTPSAEFTFASFVKQLGLVFIIAVITSYLDRGKKKHNFKKEKAN